MMQQLLLELAPPPEPTLENFAPGPNARAVAAVRELVAGSETLLSTLYLWGPLGSGRSHLLRAALKANPTQLIARDDVHRLTPPEQIEAFDQFNLQRAAGGRWIAAGDRPPGQLAIRADLRTRLGSGVVIELTPLDDDDKLAALRAHAAERGFTIGEDILAHLLRTLRRDMGTQMALLDALDRASLSMKRPLTLPFARAVLQNFLPPTP
jgi:DnaA-homolog protein